MSRVTDVILLCDLQEVFTENFEMREDPPAVIAINAWLEAGEWAPLIRFDKSIGVEKAFQACANGGALNFLDVPGFLKAVTSQTWEKADALLLLLKDEEEDRFKVYRMRDGELAPEGASP
jgi:hypothetical protein